MKDRARAKVMPRATRTSDVTRARVLAFAALGAAVSAGATLAAGATPSGSERPLAKPHVVAQVKCASCHEAPAASGSAATPPSPAQYAAAGACKTCHAAREHVSTRAGHRALAQRGELACATCHPAHEGAQGVSFGDAGAWVRWGAGAEIAGSASVAGVKNGATVPLVALAACARCHDVGSARDPIASCVSAGARAQASDPQIVRTTASSCLDEHRTYGEAGPRTVAWEGAREIAGRTPWVGAERPTGSPWLPLGGGLAGAAIAGGLVAWAQRRRSEPAARVAVPAERKKLPVINPGTCLGCHACVDACPFDVLAIDRYVAVVARPDECCGVVLCEQVCPNGSLSIAEGEPVLDRPRVDEHLESKDVPGLYLAGDLTGLPLIKNAINQGVRAIDRIAATMPRKRTGVDVVIVGAGPAGLSAALRAQEKGLTCVVLEQATIASSVKSFPRDKLVYDPPLDLPVEGELWLREASKDELLAQWTRIVRARRIDVREGRRVTAAAREGDGFVVTTSTTSSHDDVVESFRASRVVLAVGRRGTPRKIDLAVDPGAEGQVSYALADARSFAGKRVVIAGLGDTAMEAAIAIARQPETSVTIAYRGKSFTRGKSRNIEELKQLVAKGRVRLLFEAVPTAVGKTTITLSGGGAATRRTVQADALLILIGGLPSWDLLARCGLARPVNAE
ncbi:MAG: NAD(P)-binding domain-containing protein [Labilithrix sp.]|nr:NAD(P)-binding domain-containing protein [Labilithrix sp.]